MNAHEFGSHITRLINGEDLNRQETFACMQDVLLNSQNDMQQGAFLAAISAKQQTAEEIAGVWQAVYELDTAKITVKTKKPLVDNCGTGNDALKTFNISTAASLIAAADGVPIARHGSRAITSACGTIDILETFGINVECSPDTVRRSIEITGIGVFNGSSAQMHPRALGRILSSISFGTVLNLAASLANPALPAVAVRGVNHRNLLLPTVKTMREIGYSRALVVHGEVPDCSDGGIDEASTMGATFICELKHDGSISEYSISTQQMGISPAHPAELLMGTSRYTEAQRMKNLLTGHESRARTDIACLNAGLILYVADRVPSISTGYQRAMELIQTKRPINKLIDWVNVQR